jgi:hypothetical protein
MNRSTTDRVRGVLSTSLRTVGEWAAASRGVRSMGTRYERGHLLPDVAFAALDAGAVRRPDLLGPPGQG